MNIVSYGKTGLSNLFKQIGSKIDEPINSLAKFEEKDTYHLVEFDLPKFKIGDISVRIEGYDLVVEANNKNSHYEQYLSLPSDSSRDISAKFKSGRLSINIPKHQNKSSAKYIPID
jgi:HSP20 family molecular chaperone IbpA